VYACKIKETTDGSGRGARSQARETLEVIAPRRFSTDGYVDERKTTARLRQNQTQKIAKKENERQQTALKSRSGALPWLAVASAKEAERRFCSSAVENRRSLRAVEGTSDWFGGRRRERR